ncbi:MAG TPA: phosphopantothenoylcysteine decarboxylase [bacterium]|nr:phosphopantothenoylcysteine decarboxylase [bacterium]
MVSILITAGPTREHIDDVRFLSNASSGRMGFALAEAAMAAGHRATVVLGPVELSPPAGAEVLPVTSALQMQQAAADAFVTCDVLIAAAAVSDWRPAERRAGKPPRQPGAFTLELVPNPDIVAGLAEHKGDRVVYGFALESVSAGMAAAIERGRRKLERKRLDGVVVNLHDAIGRDEAEFVLCDPQGERALPGRGKRAAADAIVAAAVELWRERAGRGGQDGRE